MIIKKYCCLLVTSLILFFAHAVFADTPILDIKANHSDGPLTLSTDDSLSFSIDLDVAQANNTDADWHLVFFHSLMGWSYYDQAKGWMHIDPDVNMDDYDVVYQGPLTSIEQLTSSISNSSASINLTELNAGRYEFFFGIDLDVNNLIDSDTLLFDSLVATIKPKNTIAAVWANNGEDKVTRDESRALMNPESVINRVWDGNKVSVFGAKNEVVAFNLIIEAPVNSTANNVSVSLDRLTGADSNFITSTAVTGNDVFNWSQRNIELFYIRYLPIKGLSSNLFYDTYDERHIPKRFQRPVNAQGEVTGNWMSRPDHDKYYPDIAVPIELKGDFNIAAGENQSIWVDIFIPKTMLPGTYTGAITVSQSRHGMYNIPVELTVNDFTLPDNAHAKTMLVIGDEDINDRYLGVTYPETETEKLKSQTIRDCHFQMVHRHKISAVDANCSGNLNNDSPCPEWIDRLNGDLFTLARGYNLHNIHVLRTWVGS